MGVLYADNEKINKKVEKMNMIKEIDQDGRIEEEKKDWKTY